MAKALESSGIDAIAVHPRTRTQGYTGASDWGVIRAVRDAVKIVVIGNGDVTNRETARDMFDRTGCDAIMIGRAALADPFIFRVLNGGKEPTLEEKFDMIFDHIKLVGERETKRYTLNVVRKFMPKYLRKMNGASALFRKLGPEKSVDRMLGYIEEFRAECIGTPPLPSPETRN